MNKRSYVQLSERLLDQASVTALAETFKVLGEVTRVRILDALGHGEVPVCDLAQVLGLTQSSVSHQLRLLRSWRLVKSRRAGKHIYYVADDHHIVALFEQGLEHVQERTAGGRAEHAGAPTRRAGDKRRSTKRVAHPAAQDASGPSPSSRGTRL
jgi:DNA-binding transcriptional ArsR family regulator